MALNVQGAFVSQKINKIRWIPEEYVDTKNFITGSWDDDNNSVKVWSFESNNEEEDEVEHPTALSEYIVTADVTEIKFCNNNVVAVSLSNGDVKLFEISSYEKQTPLKEITVWNNLHNYGSESCSCTAIDTIESDIVTVGEDGALNMLDARQGRIRLSIPDADECAICCVCFVNYNEVVTGNARGELRLWDARAAAPAVAAWHADVYAATCVAAHEARANVAAGGASGTLTAWELRGGGAPPASLRETATPAPAPLTELRFPSEGDALLAGSAAGELYLWPLAGGDAARLLPPVHKPINSFDLHAGRILCSADNEAVYLIKNFKY